MPIPGSIRSLLDAGRHELALLVHAGSKSYGIDVAGSDDDYVGVFVAPLKSFVSIEGLERDTLTANDPDFTLHEIGKFCALALKGNPAILETLWSPTVLEMNRWGKELVAMRTKCLHRGSLAVYVDYADAQLRKMVRNRGLHAKGGTYNGKFGAHLVRLLHAGIHLAECGEVMVRVPGDLAALLLEIRTGKRSMEDVEKMARPLSERLGKLADANGLPAEADVQAFNDLVIRARLDEK